MSDNQNDENKTIQDKKPKGCFTCRGCVVIAVLLIVVAIVYVAPAVKDSREEAMRMACVNNMKQLALALNNYHSNYGTYPPAYTTDADGNPLHSWRVLLLPYMYQDRLYESLRLDEPWDSPHNSHFHDQMPRVYVYCCTRRPKEEREKGLTPYQMVIGPDTISNGPNCTKLSDVSSDKGDTLLFVESSVSVPWMKPEDLPQSALYNGVVSSIPLRGQPIEQGIGSPHYTYYKMAHPLAPRITGANAAMDDISCIFLTKDTPPKDLLEKSRIRKPE